MFVLRVDEDAADFAERALSADSEERRVEIRVVLAQILLLLVPATRREVATIVKALLETQATTLKTSPDEIFRVLPLSKGVPVLDQSETEAHKPGLATQRLLTS